MLSCLPSLDAANSDLTALMVFVRCIRTLAEEASMIHLHFPNQESSFGTQEDIQVHGILALFNDYPPLLTSCSFQMLVQLLYPCYLTRLSITKKAGRHKRREVKPLHPKGSPLPALSSRDFISPLSPPGDLLGRMCFHWSSSKEQSA